MTHTPPCLPRMAQASRKTEIRQPNDQGQQAKVNAVIGALNPPPPPPPPPLMVVEEAYQPMPTDVYVSTVVDADVVIVGGNTYIWVVGPDGARHRRFYAHGDHREDVFHRRDDLHRVMMNHDGHLPDHAILAHGPESPFVRLDRELAQMGHGVIRGDLTRIALERVVCTDLAGLGLRLVGLALAGVIGTRLLIRCDLGLGILDEASDLVRPRDTEHIVPSVHRRRLYQFPCAHRVGLCDLFPGYWSHA
jgi:hypothetical protein